MTITLERKRPEHKLTEVVEAEPTGRPYNKRFTSMKAAETTAEVDKVAPGSALSVPTDEQLEKINQFTQSPKTKDDVVVLHTMSANDIRDRDLDMFKTACIKKFASLPAPYSSVGKSFMVGHDTSKLPTGRIFDVGTQRQDDNLFLTNDIYMPKTEQYKNYLESVDFGIFWAVSVGVMIGETTCTVGAPHEGLNRWYCSQGHEKGLWYDPSSDEKDSWGWPEPVEQDAKGAVQCGYDFDEPTDFYELSQVYLGAQYFAELGKSSELGEVIKSASRSIPVIGLRSKEAASLPMEHLPETVVEARRDKLIIPTSDGSFRWQDEKDFIYTYDQANGEVLCVGKAVNTQAKVIEQQERLAKLHKQFDESIVGRLTECKSKLLTYVKAADADETDDPVATAESIDATLDSMRDALNECDADPADDDNFGQAMDLLTSADASIDSLVDMLGGDDPDREDDESSEPDEGSKGAELPMKKDVQAAAREAKMPSSILDKLAETDDENAWSTLVTASAERIAELDRTVKDAEPMVTAGTKYLDDLRTEVKAAYVRAKQIGEAKGVSTDTIDRLLNLAGNDVDLLKSMLTEFDTEAKTKVGSPAVVRSTFPADANRVIQSDGTKDVESAASTNGHGKVGATSSLPSRLHR